MRQRSDHHQTIEYPGHNTNPVRYSEAVLEGSENRPAISFFDISFPARLNADADNPQNKGKLKKKGTDRISRVKYLNNHSV